MLLLLGALAVACSIPALVACERGAGNAAPLEPPRFPAKIDRPTPEPRASRPNLVIVSIDTLRADRLGAYGHPRPTSPHLDALADEGVLFERAHAHSPKTAPSHMTLFTGLYPEAHRVRNRMSGEARWLGRLSEDIPTLPEMLRAAGYRTAARTAGGNFHGEIGFARGFDSFEKPTWSDAQGIFRSAIEALPGLAAGPAPFYLLVHTYQTHAPYLPPDRYRRQFVDPGYAGAIASDPDALVGVGGPPAALHRAFWQRVDREEPADRRHLLDLYDACIRFVDDQLGLLVGQLDAVGVADRTIVVVLSDHGEAFGEHAAFGHDALWQELLHVPLVLRVPQGVRDGWRGRRIAERVGLVDVLPTLLELLALPVPSHLQGRSLASLVEGRGHVRPWIFAQHRETDDVALIAEDRKLLRDAAGERLLDLAEDPGEHLDAAAEQPEARDRLAVQIERVLLTSRSYWRLTRDDADTADTADTEIDATTREQLEALGYADGDETSP